MLAVGDGQGGATAGRQDLPPGKSRSPGRARDREQGTPLPRPPSLHLYLHQPEAGAGKGGTEWSWRGTEWNVFVEELRVSKTKGQREGRGQVKGKGQE